MISKAFIELTESVTRASPIQWTFDVFLQQFQSLTTFVVRTAQMWESCNPCLFACIVDSSQSLNPVVSPNS